MTRQDLDSQIKIILDTFDFKLAVKICKYTGAEFKIKSGISLPDQKLLKIIAEDLLNEVARKYEDDPLGCHYHRQFPFVASVHSGILSLSGQFEDSYDWAAFEEAFIDELPGASNACSGDNPLDAIDFFSPRTALYEPAPKKPRKKKLASDKGLPLQSDLDKYEWVLSSEQSSMPPMSSDKGLKMSDKVALNYILKIQGY